MVVAARPLVDAESFALSAELEWLSSGDSGIARNHLRLPLWNDGKTIWGRAIPIQSLIRELREQQGR